MPRRTQKQQPSTAVVSTQPKFTKEKLRKFLLGSKEKEGFLKVFVIYALLICIGFIYIYPILYMVSQSFMTLDDLLDSSINWIPSKLNLDNYKQAAQSMDFWKSFGQSIIIAGAPTLCNLLSCSVIGYGLARFEFPGKKVVLGIILFTFILPSQITMIPTYVLYSNMGILGTIWSFVLPALLGMGINAPIFILIFWQFFRQVPKVLIEAAQIDGAGYLKSFFKYHFHLHHLLSLQYHFSHLYGTGMSHTLHRCMYQVLRQNQAGHHLLSSSVTSHQTTQIMHRLQQQP